MAAYAADQVEVSVPHWLELTDPFLRSTSLAEGTLTHRHTGLAGQWEADLRSLQVAATHTEEASSCR